MKHVSPIIIVVFASCALGLAQEQKTGRIYIGTAKAAPAWTSEITNRTTSSDQLAANAAWVKSIEAAFAEKRAEAKERSLRTDEARTLYQADPSFRTVRPEAGGAQAPRGRGIIIDYNAASLTGLISAEDGKRWSFYRGDWADFANEPVRGLWVDFVPENETGYALFVYSLGPFIPTHLQLEKAR